MRQKMPGASQRVSALHALRRTSDGNRTLNSHTVENTKKLFEGQLSPGVHRELTGQDRVDSIRAYKEIDGLLKEVRDLRELSKEADKDAPNLQSDQEEASSGLRQRKGPLPGEKVVPASSFPY